MRCFARHHPLLLLVFSISFLPLAYCANGDKKDSFLNGLEALESGKSPDAITCFNEISDSDLDFSRSRYALMLAHFQAAVNSFDVILDTISPFTLTFLAGNWETLANFFPQQIENIFQEDLWLLLYPMLIENVEQNLLQAATLSEDIITQSITLDREISWPLDFGQPGGDFFVGLTLRGTFGEGEARILASLGNLVLAITSFLGAHSWKMDFLDDSESLISLLGGFFSGLDEGDLIRSVRSLGLFATDNPEFLGKSTRWSENLGKVDNFLWQSLNNFLQDQEHNLINLLLTAPKERVFSIEDRDTSGTFSPADQVRLNGIFAINLKGIEQWENIEPINLGELLPSLSPFISPILAPVIGPAHELISLLKDCFASVDSGGGIHTVSSSDVNTLLVSLSLPELPPAARLDIPSLFLGTSGSGKSIRELFPHTDGENEFIIEGEISFGHPIYPYAPHFPPYVSVVEDIHSDIPHFSGVAGVEEIPVDKIVPLVTTDPDGYFPPNLIPYVSWQDPTINGSLDIDLSQLLMGSANEPPGFFPATNYSLNKFISSLVIDYLPRLEASPLFSAVSELPGFLGASFE